MPILFTNYISTGKLTVLGHEVVICGYHTYGSETIDNSGVRVYDNAVQILIVAYNYYDIEDDGATARIFTVAGIQFKLSVFGYGAWKLSIVDQINVPITIPSGASSIISIDSFKNVAGGLSTLTYTANIGSMSVS